MPTMPPPFRANGVRGRQAADQARPSARARGYDRNWDKESAQHRRLNPFCRYCETGAFGEVQTALADLTDHLYPQQQYPEVFWKKALWVSCCAPCHSGPKQAIEHKGRLALDQLAQAIHYPTLSEVSRD